MANKNRCTGVVQQLGTCRIEPGISSYNVSQVNTIGLDLLGCVQNVSTKIDPARTSLTPLFLGATAGMRLLNISDPTNASLIFRLIGDVFRLNTVFQVKTIDIISGQNEGLFSWVTNNYLADKLIVESFDESKPNATIGMLDMGGASAQIAYRTGHQEVRSSDDVKVRLYGVDHTVRASSNLCFGVDQGLLRYEKYLIMTRNRSERPNDPIDNPCLPIGANLTVSGQQFKDQACLSLKDKTKKFDYDRNYTFNGISDADQCSDIMNKHLLNKTECERTFDFCFNVSESRPPESTQFYAISAYYYTARVLNLSEPVSAVEYKRKTKELCSQSIDELEEKWPKTVKKFLNIYCFRLNYIYTTIDTIYRFEPLMWRNIEFRNEIRDTNLGWSLGFMINATNAVAAEKPTPPVVQLFPFVLVCVLCTLILFFSIYFALKWVKSEEKARDKSESYEPISISA